MTANMTKTLFKRELTLMSAGGFVLVIFSSISVVNMAE